MQVNGEDVILYEEDPVFEEEEPADAKNSGPKKRKKPDMPMDKYHASIWKRFLKHSKISDEPPKNGLIEKCRIYEGRMDEQGYCISTYRAVVTRVHKMSYLIKTGVEFLPKRDNNRKLLQVLHLCGHKNCIEQSHLTFGVMEIDYEKLKNLTSMEEYHKKKWQKILKRCITGTVPKSVYTLHDPCLNWTGLVQQCYGSTNYRKKVTSVHRISLMIKLKTEELPKTNEAGQLLDVRHLCNNSVCVEPSHLLLGTKLENAADKIANRSQTGENHTNATITEAVARQIKLSKFPKGHKDYKTKKARAELFGTTKSVVESIDQGRSWAFIPFADGSDSLEKLETERVKRRKTTAAKKMSNWTNVEWEKAKQKLQDNNYVQEGEIDTYADRPCKIWQKKNARNEYGSISVNGGSFAVHVVACTIANNFVRPDGLQVLHKCGNSLCVEYSHLKFGTAVENMEDKITHGTHASKFSFEECLEIRRLYADGSQKVTDLAKKFNTSEDYIRKIGRGKQRVKG